MKRKEQEAEEKATAIAQLQNQKYSTVTAGSMVYGSTVGLNAQSSTKGRLLVGSLTKTSSPKKLTSNTNKGWWFNNFV